METRIGRPTPSPGLLQGGGGGTLRWVGIMIWVALWAGLVLTLLVAGAWVAASALAVSLFALWHLPTLLDGSRLAVRGAGAALVAALAWPLGPLLAAGGWAGDLGGSAAVVAALLLLPALLAAREREVSLDPSFGPVGFSLGFVPAFAGAALAGGILVPFSGWLAQPSVWLGQMLLLAGAVPFAVVAAWSGLVGRRVASLLVIGAGSQLIVAGLDPPTGRIPDLAAATVFAIGWAGVGIALLRHAQKELADLQVGAESGTEDEMRERASQRGGLR
jgi:hypothetical protein